MIEVRALRPGDARGDFRSGNVDLDRFFHLYAGQNQFKHHVGVTYVAVEAQKILGYATVAPSQIQIEDLPAQRMKKLPRYPLPVLRLARLAVDVSAQGKGIGKSLLRFVLILARRMEETLGCVGVVVDAKEDAVSFYEKLGFELLDIVEGGSAARPHPRPMFLPVGSLPKA